MGVGLGRFGWVVGVENDERVFLGVERLAFGVGFGCGGGRDEELYVNAIKVLTVGCLTLSVSLS